MFSKIKEILQQSDADFLRDATSRARSQKIEHLRQDRFVSMVGCVIGFSLFMLLSFVQMLLIIWGLINANHSGIGSNAGLFAFVPAVIIFGFQMAFSWVLYKNADLQIKMLLLYEKTLSE